MHWSQLSREKPKVFVLALGMNQLERAVGVTMLSCVLLAGCTSVRASSAPVNEPSEAVAIRSARAAQNRAMAAGDTATAATFWTDDVEIRRGLGLLVLGRSAYQRILLPDSAAVRTGTALWYERNPVSVEVSTQWPLAYETGEWAAHQGTSGGPVVIRGRYSAQWVKRGSRWLIRGEVYVALSCAGIGCDLSAAP